MTVTVGADYAFTIGAPVLAVADPTELPGLTGWLAAEDASQVSWPDRAGPGPAVRAAGTSGSLSVGTLNGYSSVVFNNALWMAWPDLPGDVTYFVVLRPSTQAVEQVVLDGNTTPRRYLAALPSGGAFTAYTGASPSLVGGSTAGQGWQVVTLAGGAAGYLDVDGARVAAGAGGDTTGLSSVRIGTNNYDGSSRRWRGSIAEIIRYGRVLGQGEVVRVHAYLQTKFALTLPDVT